MSGLLIEKWAKFTNENDKSLPQDMTAAVGKVVSLIDDGVAMMMTPVLTPNKSINKLMTLFWRLVGNKVTPTALTNEPLNALHVWIEVQKGGEKCCIVLVPVNWPEICKKDPFMQLGGMVYTASKCVDFWHGKLQKKEDGIALEKRARAYEAEYLLLLSSLTKFKPNEYQQKLLEQFPLGLASLEEEFKYELQPFAEGDFDGIDNAYKKS
jgi:hypothetical protein